MPFLGPVFWRSIIYLRRWGKAESWIKSLVYAKHKARIIKVNLYQNSCSCLRHILDPWPKSVCVCIHTQSHPTLCQPMDCRLPSYSVHWILPVTILEESAISSSRRSSQPRDPTCISYVSWIGSRFLETLDQISTAKLTSGSILI